MSTRNLQPVKILIVDDRPENLFALDAILQPLGEEILSAGSGREALRLTLKNDFAAILMDVEMPGLDGLETARLIMEHPRTRGVPILFLTAHGHLRDLARQGYSVGAVDYLVKPIDPVAVRSKVRVFADLHRKRAVVPQDVVSSTPQDRDAAFQVWARSQGPGQGAIALTSVEDLADAGEIADSLWSSDRVLSLGDGDLALLLSVGSEPDAVAVIERVRPGPVVYTMCPQFECGLDAVLSALFDARESSVGDDPVRQIRLCGPPEPDVALGGPDVGFVVRADTREPALIRVVYPGPVGVERELEDIAHAMGAHPDDRELLVQASAEVLCTRLEDVLQRVASRSGRVIFGVPLEEAESWARGLGEAVLRLRHAGHGLALVELDERRGALDSVLAVRPDLVAMAPSLMAPGRFDPVSYATRVTMCQAANCEVLADGVLDAEQCDFAESIGVSLVAGPYPSGAVHVLSEAARWAG